MHRLLPLLLLVIVSQACAFEILPFVPPVTSTEARVLAVTSNVERELAQIDVLVEAAAWDEAVDALLRLSDESPDELLAVADSYYLPVSTAAGMRIARWPAAGIAVYRQRVDAVAQSLYERGIEQRDRESLLAVVDDYFASSVGDEALLALADRALEAGRTGEARGYLLQLSAAVIAPNGRPWGVALAGVDLADARVRDAIVKQVTAPEVRNPSTLVYPGTDIPIADILSRLAMVSIRERAFDRAERELEVLRLALPDAEATIGGRQANVVEAISATLSSARQWPAPAPLDEWTTFGGNATRGGVAGTLGEVSQVQWRRPLVQPPLQVAPQPQIFLNVNGQLMRPSALPSRPHFVYPLVSDLVVAIEQSGQWLPLDPATGQPLYGQDIPAVANRRDPNRVLRLENRDNPIQRPLGEALQQARIQVGRNGRIVIQNRVLQGGVIAPVILENGAGGISTTQLPPAPPAAMLGTLLYQLKTSVDRSGAKQHHLEAIDLAAEGKLRLELEPGDALSVTGPPVVTDDYLFVPLRDSAAGGRVAIACYARNDGRQLWQTPVASVSENGSAPADLLVVGDGMLFLSTDGGVVVAVRSSDGRVQWARTYERTNSSKPNDLSQVASRQFGTAVLADGALVCVPADSPVMFALDPVSGRTLWVNDQAWDVDELLGVAGGRLIATGRQLWIIDPASGKTQLVWPDTLDAEITGSGRGCIAGDEIFWPTQRAIYVFDSNSGQQSRNPIALDELDGVGGANLVPCGDGLLVATQKELILLGAKAANQEQEPQQQPELSSHRATRPLVAVE